MQHNIKKLACLLAILLLGSCCPADAKSIEIRGTPGSVEAGSTMLLDGFNFPELIYRISDDLSYECFIYTRFHSLDFVLGSRPILPYPSGYSQALPSAQE